MTGAEEQRSSSLQVGDFGRIESTGRPEQFVEWMALRRAATGPDRAIDALHLGPGDVALDVGCGPGSDLAEMADRCQHAVGLDLSPSMLAAARGHDRKNALVAGDGCRLPFGSETFDAAWARAVLIHTPDPAALVGETARVLRPGGRLVLSEPDHASHIVATDVVGVLERIKAHRRTKFAKPLVGRSLAGLAVDAGLRVSAAWVTPIVHRSLAVARAAGGPFDRATADAVADGAITSAEGDRYLASLEVDDGRGAFFFAALTVTVVANAPNGRVRL